MGRRKTLVLATFGTLGCVLTVAAVAIASGSQSRPTAEVSAALHDVALTMAKENGGDIPASADAVLTTRGEAFSLYGSPNDSLGEVGGETVYLVELEGKFTAYLASIPPGMEVPTGVALIFAYDAEHARVTDWGVIPRVVDLSKLGDTFTVELTSEPLPT